MNAPRNPKRAVRALYLVDQRDTQKHPPPEIESAVIVYRGERYSYTPISAAEEHA